MTHLDGEGRARMVDVGSKAETHRVAAVARIAAIQGAKQTPSLVPLCHPIGLDAISADVEATESGARVVVTVEVTAKTGVEMEAMTGAAIGAIALYDMIKAVDRGAVIGPVQLLSKSGGKSGDWKR